MALRKKARYTEKRIKAKSKLLFKILGYLV